MTKLVIQHREIESQIASLTAQLAAIEADPSYVEERAFVDSLDALLAEYGKGLRDCIAILDPSPAPRADNQGKGNRGPRKVQRYVNPHTGEVVETAGGNNRVLRAWKEQYPNENIRHWIK